MQIEQFKEKFVEEAYGLISQLEESLLEQEDNLQSAESIQQIFRVMHTLKGVSSMYGFIHIGEVAHDLESIFDLIRDGKQEFTPDIFEITLKTVDHFRLLLEDETLANKENQERQKILLAEIKKVLETVNINSQSKASDAEVINEPDTVQKETFYIIFYPNEQLLFRGINVLRLFEELAGLGEYKVVNHAFKEPSQENSEINAWGIYLVTDQGIDGIEDVFMFVLDDVRILKISDNNLFNFKEFTDRLDHIEEQTVENNSDTIQHEIEQTIENINAKNKVETKPKIEKPNEIEPENNKAATTTDEDKPKALPKNGYNDVGKQLTSRISIDSAKLDRLMYLVSELVITKSQLNLVVEKQEYHNLISIAEKIDDLSRSFRDNALNIRLVPVAEMIVPFKRMIRDLSKDLGKEVKFITQGIDTELDKNVIDRLAEPVMHILRNCIDHGIEKPDVRLANDKTSFGTIKFTSFYSGANVFIQIQDDGAGIDPEKIRNKAIEKGLISADDKLREREIYDLIFEPGFSTATQVSEVSGRGVGMDIVRKKINEVRGEVEVNSELGLGTYITIKLHQTLSIIDTLLLKVEDTHYLVPVSDIEYVEQETHKNLYRSNNRQVEVDGNLIPFVSLRDLNNHGQNYPVKEKLVIINKNERRIAIVVDKIVGDHQAVLKPLGEVFQSQKYLSGASILGDGTLALMLDTNKLVTSNIIKEITSNTVTI